MDGKITPVQSIKGVALCHVFPQWEWGRLRGVGRGVEGKESVELKDNLPYRTHVLLRCFRAATWMRRPIG